MAKASKVSVKTLRIQMEILGRLKRIEDSLGIKEPYAAPVGLSRAEMKAKSEEKPEVEKPKEEPKAEKKAKK